MSKVALLIIDVQKDPARKSKLPEKIAALQAKYKHIFVSQFQNKKSPILKLVKWAGYQDDNLAFTPAPHAVVFRKTGYSAYLLEMSAFDEIHLCGCYTDCCIYKTAMDLIEKGIRPVVLKDYCFSRNKRCHNMGLQLLAHNIGTRNIR
ncbi:MAG: cysteine hydrolase [Alphaproteobacteria bacterium]|nr:cysteine hydrolase [Alphaproteobacteria bacterium]